jgi:glutathione-regulated potassium-efflux system ancillary protein KefG
MVILARLKETTMTKTLILLFHPDLSRSKSNAALAAVAANVPGVEIVNMQSAYPSGMDMFQDGEREAGGFCRPIGSCFSFRSSGIRRPRC